MKMTSLKIWSLIFFLLAFFMNPVIAGQITRHHFIFSSFLMGLGLCFYFNLTKPLGLVRRLTSLLEFKQGWPALGLVILIFLFFLSFNPQYLNYPLHAGWGDEPSYTGFDFSSLTSILGNHRTVGLPLLLKGYHLFFHDLTVWPYLQVAVFILSLFALYAALKNFGIHPLAALFMVCLLLWDRTNYSQFLNVQTECMTASFLNFTIASLFWCLHRWHVGSAGVLTLFSFALFQIRPNFSFMALLLPLWGFVILWIKNKASIQTVKKIIFPIALCTLIPLFAFCFLRLAVVGQFGLVSMTGGCLSGHAAHYLDEKNVKTLSGKIRTLADEILIRKRQLTPPNNLSPFGWIKLFNDAKKIEMEAYAFGPDLINAWTVAIKQLKGVEPFDDPKKNIDPMQYALPLSAFHAKYFNYETDRLLTDFSIAILSQEWKKYLHWILGGSIYGMNLLIKSKAFWLTWLGLLALLKILYLNLSTSIDRDRLKVWHQDTLILAMLGISLFILGYIPIILFNFPFARLLDLISLYLLPVLFCWAVPPIWLKTSLKPQNSETTP